jgi:hypothetical protein
MEELTDEQKYGVFYYYKGNKQDVLDMSNEKLYELYLDIQAKKESGELN